MPGRVAREEDVVLGRAAQLMWDPVALVADGREAEVAREAHRGLLDVMRGPEGADADAQLVARREAPRVAGADIGGVDPELQILAAPARMDLQAAREAGVGRLDRRGVGKHAPPAESVDDERRAHLAAIRLNDGPGAPTAARTARGSRTWRTTRAAASARYGRACARRARRSSGAASPSARAPAARLSAWRRRTSGARRSRSGR